MIEEYDFAFVSRLFVAFNFQLYAHIGLGRAAQVDGAEHLDVKTDSAVDSHGLVEFELFDSVIDLILDVSNVHNLLPKVRKY